MIKYFASYLIVNKVTTAKRVTKMNIVFILLYLQMKMYHACFKFTKLKVVDKTTHVYMYIATERKPHS